MSRPSHVQAVVPAEIGTERITTLELELPDSVKDVRLADLVREKASSRLLATRPGQAKRVSADAGALGPVKHVELSWKVPATLPAGPPLLAAEGRITVRADEASITTDADFTLFVVKTPPVSHGFAEWMTHRSSRWLPGMAEAPVVLR